MTPDENYRKKLVEIVDAACWSARKAFGHDDWGLPDGYGVALDGRRVPWDNMIDGVYVEDYHPQAIDAADKILAAVDELVARAIQATVPHESLSDEAFEAIYRTAMGGL